jgi:prepilin-type N-terminal cleavage/methylation domain-containing protein
MRPQRPSTGFTLVEMLATMAALLIVLGLMVGLARHVRSTSAKELTNDLLRRLDQAMARYVRLNDDQPPNLPPFISGPDPVTDNAALARRAQLNNIAAMRLLQEYHVIRLEELPVSYSDGLPVCDAWGSPIVFMPSMNPAVGMAAKGWFFFSAGLDRKYTTKSDNLYSYELPGLDQPEP